MFSSLRFRLPALFLLGIVVSGLIAAAVALRLFQGYVLSRSKADLRREAIGLTEVLAQQAITANDTGALPRIARQLERATGDRLFYVGVARGNHRRRPARVVPVAPNHAARAGVVARDGRDRARKLRRRSASGPWWGRDRTSIRPFQGDGRAPVRRRAAGAQLPHDRLARA